jgi:stage II sporulation protein AA (anti-sigma F factor antagonist)
MTDLGEFDYHWLEEETLRLHDMVEHPDVRHVIIDLRLTTNFGSSALGMFVAIWKRLNEKQGRLVLCGISPKEHQILRAVRLDGQWKLCDSRDEALRALSA